jgi:hypothetical protein
LWGGVENIHPLGCSKLHEVCKHMMEKIGMQEGNDLVAVTN